jgi:hypothetical protein
VFVLFYCMVFAEKTTDDEEWAQETEEIVDSFWI